MLSVKISLDPEGLKQKQRSRNYEGPMNYFLLSSTKSRKGVVLGPAIQSTAKR
jgi:hypothetical protein